MVTGFLGGPEPSGTALVSPDAMIRSRLWLEFDLVIGFTVGLGLGSLMGQRTIPVILLIMLEIIITPPLADHALPHFVDGERLVVGVAMDQLKPAALAGGTTVGPGGGPRGAAHTAHAHLGPGDRHRRLDHRLVRHRRLEDDHPRRLTGTLLTRPRKGNRQR